MMPVNRVGGAFCAPSNSLVGNVFFVFHREGTIHRPPRSSKGARMPNLMIPPQYRLRVKQRLKIVQYAEEHGVKPAGRHFGLDRKTVREWRDRHRELGVAGLLPRYPKRRRRRVPTAVIPLVREARTEHRFGAARTRIWLQ